MNRVKTARTTGIRRYAYPRYLFCNESSDIRDLFVDACRRFNIEPRYTKANTLSVARKELVALLDTFIGPKR
jgi:hypothetical protein